MEFFDLIRGWEAWLRDPNHKQAQGVLHVKDRDSGEDKYCCLGGLCEVVMQLDPDYKGETWKTVEDRPLVYEFLGEASLIPYQLVRKYELAFGSNPDLNIPEHLTQKAGWIPARNYKPYRSATELNDNYNFTFDEIAECVRETWPLAFTTNEEVPTP
jgi:hypothetical protein